MRLCIPLLLAGLLGQSNVLAWVVNLKRESMTFAELEHSKYKGILTQAEQVTPPEASKMTLSESMRNIVAGLKSNRAIDLSRTSGTRPICAIFHSGIYTIKDVNLKGMRQDAQKLIDTKHDKPSEQACTAYLDLDTISSEWEKTQVGYKGKDEWKWWSAFSVAFGVTVPGPKAYVVLPKGKPLNRSRADKGGNFWWFEARILTTLRQVKELYRIDFDAEKMASWKEGSPYPLGDPYLIWKDTDSPMGAIDKSVNQMPELPGRDEQDEWGPSCPAQHRSKHP